MATSDDAVTAIADSYAEALLTLSERGGLSDRVLEELGELAACFEKDPTIADFFSSPAVDETARQAALEKMFRGRFDDLTVDALQVLNAKGRAALVPAVYERFRLGLERVRGEIDVIVTSAVALGTGARERLAKAMQARIGKKPQLIERVDESLLGGLVVQVGDEKLDCSVANRLATLRESFRERASREIHAGTVYIEES